MKLSLRGGHSANCQGAVGLRNEYTCMQELYKYTEQVLKKYGHTVINCNSNGSNSNAELSEGARKSNNANVDLFISLHMNALNGNAYGTEAWVHSKGCRAEAVAKRLVNNFATLGFYNRGVKYNAKYYEMRNVSAPNIIFETCFCDSQKDVAIMDSTTYEKMAYLIANAIDSNIPKNPVATEQVKFNPTLYINSNVNVPIYKEMELKTKIGEVVPGEKVAYNYSNEKSAYITLKSSLKVCIDKKYITNIREEPIKEETKPQQKPSEEVEGGLYKVQAGAFKSKENAEKYIEELKKKGINACIKKE